MASEIQIDKKNLEAELTVIRSEIESEAVKLGEILSQKKLIEQEAISIQEKRIEFEKHCSEQREIINTMNSELHLAKLRSEEQIALNNSILKKINEDIKESIKKLSWMNEKIMNSESAIEEKSAEKSKLDAEIENLISIVSHKEEEENKLTQAIDSRQSIELSIEQKRRSTEEYIAAVKAELEILRNEIAEKTKERDRIQLDTKLYTDQLYTAMNDFHILRSRLEVRWKEHYPELELPLMI